jgi:hypothetical protein
LTRTAQAWGRVRIERMPGFGDARSDERTERALKQAHCRLGKVHRPRHVARHRVLRVTKQSARPRSNHTANFPVNVTLG